MKRVVATEDQGCIRVVPGFIARLPATSQELQRLLPAFQTCRFALSTCRYKLRHSLPNLNLWSLDLESCSAFMIGRHVDCF